MILMLRVYDEVSDKGPFGSFGSKTLACKNGLVAKWDGFEIETGFRNLASVFDASFA